MYYERTIEAAIKKIDETFPVLIVTGPRQGRIAGQSNHKSLCEKRSRNVFTAVSAAGADR